MIVKYSVTGENVSVKLSGELDTPSSVEIQGEIEKILEHSSKNIEIDCQDLSYIASSGLRLLITVHKRCTADGGHMSLLNVSPDVMEILCVTSFDKIFDIRQ